MRYPDPRIGWRKLRQSGTIQQVSCRGETVTFSFSGAAVDEAVEEAALTVSQLISAQFSLPFEFSADAFIEWPAQCPSCLTPMSAENLMWYEIPVAPHAVTALNLVPQLVMRIALHGPLCSECYGKLLSIDAERQKLREMVPEAPNHKNARPISEMLSDFLTRASGRSSQAGQEYRLRWDQLTNAKDSIRNVEFAFPQREIGTASGRAQEVTVALREYLTSHSDFRIRFRGNQTYAQLFEDANSG